MTPTVSERTAKRRARQGGWLEWIRSEADLRAARRGCVFNQVKADRIITFFSRFLRHSKGRFAGRPFEPLEWQARRFLMPLFGWQRPDGTRRFRRALVFVPRKNGKSVLASGLGLYGLACDGEAAAEVYCVGASREQASQIYNSASEIVRASPELRKRIDLVPSTKRMVFAQSMSRLAVLTPDADKALGVNPSMVLFDELISQPNRNLWDALRFAPGSRTQPLWLSITTAGWEKESIAGEEYEYACGVRDGRIDDDSYLPLVFEASPEDDPGNPATWKKANPSLGETITVSSVEEEYNEAKNVPRKMAGFKMYRCNMWVSTANAFIDITQWDKCSRRRKPGESPMQWRIRVLEQLAADQTPCWLGMDLGGSRDLTALTGIFRPEQDFYIIVPWIWVPEMCTRPSERPIIEGLITDKFIKTMPGDWTDFVAIEDHILDVADRFNVVELAYDRHYAGPMIQRLIGEGIECTPVAQNCATLNDPTRELERLILAQKIDHGDNPALRWTAGNLTVYQNRGGQLMPVKPKSAQKIDPMTALITALARAMLLPDSPVYTSVDDFFAVSRDNG